MFSMQNNCTINVIELKQVSKDWCRARTAKEDEATCFYTTNAWSKLLRRASTSMTGFC